MFASRSIFRAKGEANTRSEAVVLEGGGLLSAILTFRGSSAGGGGGEGVEPGEEEEEEDAGAGGAAASRVKLAKADTSLASSTVTIIGSPH